MKSSDEVLCTFYEAVCSTKFVGTLSIAELSQVLQLTEIPDKLSQDHLRFLYSHFEDELRKCGLVRGDEKEKSSAQTSNPSQNYINLAKDALDEGDLHAACRHAKTSVAHAREAISSALSDTEVAEGKTAIGTAYTIMGDAFSRLDKPVKASTCYALALQAVPELGQPRRSASWALVQLSSEAEEEKENGNINQTQTDDDPWGIRSMGDIEDLISGHKVLSTGQATGFACSQCGACCRSRDHIGLSPLDIYNISRAPTMSTHLLVPTMRLYRHPTFGKAFVFGKSADGYPICELRPKQSQSGRCNFSYPLFTTRTTDKDTTQLNAEDIEEYLGFHQEHNLAIEKEADDIWDEMWQLREEEMELKFPNVEPIMNSNGQQALGCMLATDHMPTLCASYPLVPEQDVAGQLQVDPSEVSRVSAAIGDGVRLPTAETNAKSKLLVRPFEESYIMYHSLGCEGFDTEGVEEKTDTIEDYLSQNDLRSRWEETRWFGSLRQSISQYLQCSTMGDDIREVYTQALRRIWFDFDCLAHARRPVRSYARLKAQITEASWSLARATKVFLDHRNEEKDEILLTEYETLVRAMEIVVN